LAAQQLAADLGGGDAGADAFLRQLALELGDAGQERRHHAPVRRREVERHAVQRHQRHAPALQLLERGQQVRRAAAPARQLCHQHRHLHQCKVGTRQNPVPQILPIRLPTTPSHDRLR